jgi:hypothetical protein
VCHRALMIAKAGDEHPPGAGELSFTGL